MASNQKIDKNYRKNYIKPWHEAHERFTRNQEYRIKKFKISTTAEHYMKTPGNLSEIDALELNHRCRSRQSNNPYEDTELTKSIALAEHRNLSLNEMQQFRVDVARRRQGQFVAAGHAFDNEHVMKSHILPNIPGKLDLHQAMVKDLAREARENMGILKSKSAVDFCGKNGDNRVEKQDAELTDDEILADFQNSISDQKFLSENFQIPACYFRLKFQDKKAEISDLIPKEYKYLVSAKNKDKQVEVNRLLQLSKSKTREKNEVANQKFAQQNFNYPDQMTGDKILYGLQAHLPCPGKAGKQPVQMSYGKIQENIKILTSQAGC